MKAADTIGAKTSRETALQNRPGWRDMLAAVPIRNEAAEVSRGAEEVRIRVALERPAWLRGPLRFLMRFRAHRSSRLTGPGLDVWTMCDGKCTTEQLVDRFARENRLTFHESRVAVGEYLKSLVQRGVIVMSVPKTEGRR